jgi:hypothetical protein
MNFKPYIVVFGLALTPWLSTLAESPEIQPFGSLRWDDGLLDVVTKLNQLPELQSLIWHADGFSSDNSPSVLHLSKSEELSRIAPPAYGFNSDPFIDFDGSPAKAPGNPKDAKIIASPVNIAGIPFVLTANLTQSFGFTVTNPTKVITFATQIGDLKLPVVLSHVTLQSVSPSIPENLDELLATVKAKYPSGVVHEEKEEHSRTGGFSVKDESSGEFKIQWEIFPEKSEVTIDYYSGNAYFKWEDLYRKHLSALEDKQKIKTPDLKTGL